ncbi:CIC11C00000002338 [Sungouiella intermedia]|uniref:CIC11C00000002338 n=1 Tax=Sungouiella intermedia TaxID=45354 RepID=A0A1L0D680_9ASCO|nr:CIC11C00000002338 [[Candida] intermedia]
MNSIKKLVISLEPFYPGASLSSTPDLDQLKTVAEEDEDKIDQPDELVVEDTKLVRKRTWWSVISAVYFTIFIRPVLLVWLLITFPFTYFFEHDYPAMETEDENEADMRREMLRSDIDEKTELLKREKIMANHIKSPTASKYIIPPPPRLFPRSRNPEKKRKRKTLILDLDETLIHSLSRGAPRSLGSSNSCHMIELKVNNVATLYYVYKRPFCDFFLKEISRWFELQIFTASVKEYADPIIDWLESEIVDHKLAGKSGAKSIFTKRYYRGDCTYRQGVGYIKDLSQFVAKEEDLKNVVILDNSPVSYALQEHNGVMIEGWINDQNDRDLLNLLPMLYSLSLCIDVRFIIGLRNGEKLFEQK